jgi:hypothetical protein
MKPEKLRSSLRNLEKMPWQQAASVRGSGRVDLHTSAANTMRK